MCTDLNKDMRARAMWSKESSLELDIPLCIRMLMISGSERRDH